jgi:hypothetical protein
MWRNILSTHLESKDLMNAQQMEVAVNGPDGATHLVLCAGIVNLGSCSHETFTFLVGPSLSRRQFVGAIASGALSTIHLHDDLFAGPNPETELRATLIEITATYDEESGQVKVSTQVLSSNSVAKLAIGYQVSILAELPVF